MEEASIVPEKRTRRRGKKQHKTEADIELAQVTDNSEKVTTANENDEAKTWIETEESKLAQSSKKSKKSEKKKKEIITESSETTTLDNDDPKLEKDPLKEENVVDEPQSGESSATKKKRFNFKLPDLNPLKMRKKKLDPGDKDKELSEEKVVDKNDSEIKTEEKGEDHKDNVSLKHEDTLNEEEKSEAENVIHELPSASSGERKEEIGKKLSAKEKLKQKLDKKKSSEREPAKLLRHLSTQSSRLEDRLKEEDNDAQLAFDRHDLAMKKKRQKNDDEISAQDALDFFTGSWDDKPVVEKSAKKPEKKDSKEKSVDEDEEEEGYETANEELDSDDRKKLYSKEYIGSEYVWEVTEWQGPEIVPYTTRIENEKEVYFTPSSFPPTTEELGQVHNQYSNRD